MTPHGEYEPNAFPSVRDQVARYEATDGREDGTLEGRPVIVLTHRGGMARLRRLPRQHRPGHSRLRPAAPRIGEAHPPDEDPPFE